LTSSLVRGAFIALSICSVGACGGAAQQHATPEPLPGWNQPTKPTDKSLNSVSLVKTQLIASVHSSIGLQGHPGRAIVRDTTMWRRVWNDAHNATATPPLPEVDFSRDMVLAVAADLRSMDSLAVDTVAKTSKGMVAVVSIEHQCGPVNDFLSPVLLLLVPRAPSVSFVERRRGAECDRN
jgi:hypothetical protein